MRLLLPLLLILGGCASPEYEGVEHLGQRATIYSVQREQRLEAALAERRAIDERHELRMAHVRKLRNTVTNQPSYLLPHEKGH